MKPTKEYNGRSRIRMYNCDCMDLMKTGSWDLAIVDPPYGIGASNIMKYTSAKFTEYKRKNWDNNIPSKNYFSELVSVSKNQIIWGGNYFTNLLPVSPKWVVWDKKIAKGMNLSSHELAWTSFKSAKETMYRQSASWANGGDSKNTANRREDRKRLGRIHPTQKPVKLYKWLLTNYAKEGDTILDTHGGSLSIAIACWDLGFDLDVCELDNDYFNDAVKRFENHISQGQLF